MPKLKISVDLAEDALAISQLSRREAGEEMRRLFFVELVRAGRLPYTKAAELLEVSQAEFLAVMARHQISPFAFAEGELEAELGRAR